MGTSKGDLRKRVELDQREQVIRISGVKSAPTMVVFDENNAMLKTLTFEQPTRWLATQLRARSRSLEPELGDRAAVPPDRRFGGGGGAGKRGPGADYYLTRAEAAAALRGFPESVATPPLEAAMRDTSSTVRQAAIAALAGVGGDRALAAAQAAWTSDSSYEVRAAALAALARLDSAGAKEAVLAGLTTPSYRDVIQNAAIAAAAQAPDSAMIEGLEKILGRAEATSPGAGRSGLEGRYAGAHRAGAPQERHSALGAALGAGGD